MIDVTQPPYSVRHDAPCAAILESAFAQGGTVYLPAGVYYLDRPVVVRNAVTIIGDGHGGQIGPDTGTVVIPQASQPVNPGATVCGFLIQSTQAVTIERLGFVGGTGAHVYMDGVGSTFGNSNLLRDVRFHAGDMGVDMGNSVLWAIDRCLFDQQRQAGIRVRNTQNADAGDSTIVNSAFSGGANLGMVYVQSSGGLRVTNNKMVGGRYGVNLAYDPSVGTPNTGILLVHGNSIEGVGKACVNLSRPGGQGTWSSVAITGNELGTGTAELQCFGVLCPDAGADWVWGLTLTANNFFLVKPADCAIWLQSIVGGIVGMNSVWGGPDTFQGFWTPGKVVGLPNALAGGVA